MGSVTLSIPHELALDLRDLYHLNVLVETGTYKGGTAFWAVGHFKRVISIEADERWYNRAVDRAKREGITNLDLRRGDSRALLTTALADAGEPALLWLDAHWCGRAERAHAVGNECPLASELQIANESGVNHIIMIDDARLFINGPDRPHDPAQWPRYGAIVRLLHPRRVRVEQDVIIAEPT
jgi:hypothetical protein